MKNRKERLQVIVDLLSNKSIKNQEQLAEELKMLGFIVTQATLSRDLKQLKSSKIPDGMGGYRYVVSEFDANNLSADAISFQLPLRPIVHSIARSSNVIVIKSPVSHARLLSRAFDSLKDERVVGSIVVESTIVLYIKPHLDAASVCQVLSMVMTTDIVSRYMNVLSEGAE